MKFILSLLFLLTIVSFRVSAQTSSPSPSAVPKGPSPTVSEEQKEIDALKEKIATKVAQLREKNNRAIGGTIRVKDDSKKTLKIVDDEGTEYEVKIDQDLTEFMQIVGNQSKEITFDALKKDLYIIITGVINEKVIDANIVYVDEHFLVNQGKVIEVNKDDFSLKVITNDKENYTVDIETSTRQQILNSKTLELERIGFSKIKEGDTIHFVVKKTGLEREVNRFTAQKILIVPQEYFVK